MNEYLVLWAIDAEADTPRQAARQARAAQVRPGTLAVVFDVQDTATGVVTRVDLLTPGSDDHVISSAPVVDHGGPPHRHDSDGNVSF